MPTGFKIDLAYAVFVIIGLILYIILKRKEDKKQRDKITIAMSGLFVKDDRSGSYTGFFSLFPEAIAAGNTIEEVEAKLFDLLPHVLDTKNKLALKDLSNERFETKSYSVEI